MLRDKQVQSLFEGYYFNRNNQYDDRKRTVSNYSAFSEN